MCDLLFYKHPIWEYLLCLYKQGPKRVARLALSVQEMEISDKDFQELFQNYAASIPLLYKSNMAPYALNNNLFDVRFFKTILAGL